jgi:hypothetical protein
MRFVLSTFLTKNVILVCDRELNANHRSDNVVATLRAFHAFVVGLPPDIRFEKLKDFRLLLRKERGSSA